VGIINKLGKLRTALRMSIMHERLHEEQKLLVAKLLVERIKEKKSIESLKDVEFSVFSQWGDDGIIQWLINNVSIPHRTFVEFGVGDYKESNTRFLMVNDNWSGFVMDKSKKNIADMRESDFFWKHNLSAEAVFVDCDNINTILGALPFDREIGLLHIDVDGNDYWLWKALAVVTPIIVIMEYNPIFAIDRAITIPYERTFDRTEAHYSNLYFGASVKALCHLAEAKGYAFLGCNSAGNNAYFVRKDRVSENVREVSLEEGFVDSKARESRDRKGRLTLLSGADRLGAIKGMPVHNVLNEQTEVL
jgi:hypothetical protein